VGVLAGLPWIHLAKMAGSYRSMVGTGGVRYIGTMPTASTANVIQPLAGFLLGICSLAATCHGADRTPVAWRVGVELDQHLYANAAAVWSGVRLEEALDSLADAHRICIVLDRRIDLNQEINFDKGDVPFLDLVREGVETLKLGVGTLGPVVYVGPPQHALLAATAAAHANDQFGLVARGAGEAVMSARQFEWDTLSQPRQLIAELATRNGLRIKNIEAVPHDLWRARKLPEMLPGEQLTLLLIGFDLYFRLDPNQREIILTRFPKNLTIRREYPTERDGNMMAARLSGAFPQVFLQGKAKSILVRGTYEEQQAIRAWIENGGREPRKNTAKSTSADTRQSDERFTLKIEHQPLKPLMTVLARRLGLTLEWKNVTEEQASMRVTFDVKEVPRETLIEAVLAGTSVVAEFQGNQLILSGSADK
jgi:hypothetical protein